MVDVAMTGVAESANTNLRDSLPGKTGAFSRFEWMLARRYLGSRRKETFISVISIISFVGIMLGVATLIIVMAVMNGFRTELLDRILGINGHLIVAPTEYALTDYDAVASRLEAVDGVIYAFPLIEGEVLASGGKGGSGARVRGMREGDLKRLPSVGSNIVEGTLDGFDAGDGVAIGAVMARNLNLYLGDSITLVTPDGNKTAFGVTPRVKSYPVTAIFEMGMSEYDNIFVFMPLLEAQLYFNKEQVVDVIETFITDADDVEKMRGPMEAGAERPISVSDWRQRNASFFSALEVERNVMFLILTLILLIAALNIVSGLFMLVKEKGSDIAILRTMGATRGAVMRIFLITGASIGVFGTIAGFGLGVLFSQNINAMGEGLSSLLGTSVWDPTVRFLSEIPARLDMGETLMVVFMALGLSLLATLFPAWRAARLDPVEALRYE
ncbi:lipoprotein releasing system transmembrane protein [Ahrensia sp. R2A130]|nr:lipoprotein releasing system transmembrane protein [Ahrensia sp. R2A130]